MNDAWESGDPYEYFMGRWSRLVAQSFLEWLAPSTGLKWLDVGCGSGALSEAALQAFDPAELTVVDQSQGFVNAAKARLGSAAKCRVGDALALPLDDSSVDLTVSGLVLNFIPDPIRALTEMKRVTVRGGTVAVYIWDYAGTMEFLSRFWDAAISLNRNAARLHEASRFPDSNSDELKRLFEAVGFGEIETTPIDIRTRFQNFDDYWQPFLGGQGPAPTYLASLAHDDREQLRAALLELLPIQADGSIPLNARAWAVRGNLGRQVAHLKSR